MRRRSLAAIGGVVLSLAFAGSASAQFSPGARTLGDPYYVNVGNGGYDAQHYDVTIGYDPVAHAMTSSVDATLRATQGLSEFSLDFVDYYTVSSVTVNGAPATFTKDVDAAAYKFKLVVTPPAGIPSGSTFHVVVNYSGTPQNFRDPDNSLEGFMRTTATLGAFVMNEPVGAMGWIPNNNHPIDKATFAYHLTAPSNYTAIGNGELASKVENPNGTSTWNWTIGYPVASYLTTATTGIYDFRDFTGATATGFTGQPLKLYSFIESSLPANVKTADTTAANRQDAIIRFMEDKIGAPYPFDSHGVVAGRGPTGGTYALEVATKSHFGNGSISLGTLAHEIAHQWFGDSVGPASWREIWFNEGWATWWSTYWSNQQNNNATTNLAYFNTRYDGWTADQWATPPTELAGPEELFENDPVYARPAMMWESLRQILGDTAFFAFQKALAVDFKDKTVTEAQIVATAKRVAAATAGFDATNLAKLDTFFGQWLHSRTRPTLTHRNFYLSTATPGTVAGTVAPTLSLVLGTTPSFGQFVAGTAREYTATTTATVTSSAGDAALIVQDTSPFFTNRLVNGSFALAQELRVRNNVGAFQTMPAGLRFWSGPTAAEPVPVELRQAITANEPLRSGTYAKPLTFTLSTTTP
jgi:aminopeptidase N